MTTQPDWQVPCPRCDAPAHAECTSVLTGAVLATGHMERWRLAGRTATAGTCAMPEPKYVLQQEFELEPSYVFELDAVEDHDAEPLIIIAHGHQMLARLVLKFLNETHASLVATSEAIDRGGD